MPSTLAQVTLAAEVLPLEPVRPGNRQRAQQVIGESNVRSYERAHPAIYLQPEDAPAYRRQSGQSWMPI